MASSVATKNFFSQSLGLDIAEGAVHVGQGEYVVFHSSTQEEKKTLTRETYERVYQVFHEFSPAVVASQNSDLGISSSESRYEKMKSKVKEIDSTLELVFIPKTLYELIFIRKCIKEDIKRNDVRPKLCRMNRPEEKKCWHLCCFRDAGDNNHLTLKDLAYRLNQVVVKTLSPKAEGFTYQEFSQYGEDEIAFLRHHFEHTSIDFINKCKTNCSARGPAINFAYDELPRGLIRPMGVRDSQNYKDVQMIRDAIAIDCSKDAQRNFFLYRGTESFKKDFVVSSWNDQEPYSLSFGSSLFAGAVHDPAATAFYYMRSHTYAYAIPIPFDQINSSPFFIPPTHTLAQLFGKGECFHGRTKVWEGYKFDTVSDIEGISPCVNDCTDFLKSTLSKDELVHQFREYKRQSVMLKS